jgi:hypothetical protein
MMNREIKTDLHNILEHVVCSHDYGYHDDVLMTDFGILTGYVSDNEIESYIKTAATHEYIEEDKRYWREALTEWRNKYTKQRI